MSESITYPDIRNLVNSESVETMGEPSNVHHIATCTSCSRILVTGLSEDEREMLGKWLEIAGHTFSDNQTGPKTEPDIHHALKSACDEMT